MAIQQAEAKLYQGFRAYVVDENITANLSASFTVGNRNVPSPQLDGNGNYIIYPGILGSKIIKSIATLVCEPQTSFSGRYKTKGGGNNVITAAGVDNTNNWKMLSTLKCKFPTYFRLDIEALGLPEGIDCVIQMEDGFVIEGDYPGSFKSPNSFNSSFTTFRTPKRLWNVHLSSQSLMIPLMGFRRLANVGLNVVSTMVPRITYNPGRFASLEMSYFQQSTQARKNVNSGINMLSQFIFPIGNFRLRIADIASYNVLSSTNVETYNSRKRYGIITPPTIVSTLVAPTELSRIRKVSTEISSTSTMNIVATKTTNITLNLPAFTSELAVYTVLNILEPLEMTSTSMMAIDADPLPMVMNITSPGYMSQLRLWVSGNCNAVVDWGDGTTTSIVGNFGTTQTGFPGASFVQGGNQYYGKDYRSTPLGIQRDFTIKITGSIEHFHRIDGSQGGFYTKNITTYGELGLKTIPRLECVYPYSSPDAVNYITTIPTHIPATVETISPRYFSSLINADYSGANYWNTSNIKNISEICRQAFYWTTAEAQASNGSNTQYVTLTMPDFSLWNTSSVTNMYAVFLDAVGFNQNISSWNTSNVTDMSYMFGKMYSPGMTSKFNQNISGWNTGNVATMESMFKEQPLFNQDLSGWNASKVTSMKRMFDGCYAFNGGIPTNTPLLTDTSYMFSNATAFNHTSIESLNVSNVTNMEYMFQNTNAFNKNLGSWDTGKVTSMKGMFQHPDSLFTSHYNGTGIHLWNTSSVTDMSYMLHYAVAFNNNLIGAWDVSNVTTMYNIFRRTGSGAFNPNIGSWNVGKVQNFQEMFAFQTSFNQNISGWNVSSATNMSGMLSGTAITCSLASWDVSKCINFNSMLRGIPQNPDIANWNVSSGRNFYQMLPEQFNRDLSNWRPDPTAFNLDVVGYSPYNGNWSQANRDKTIIGWANWVYNNTPTPGMPRGVTNTYTWGTPTSTNYGGTPFSDAVSAKAYLTNTGAHPVGANWI